MPARNAITAACGLDFGTSNSALALPDGDSVRLVPLEGEATSMPSAIFFAIEDAHKVSYGRAAIREYLDGTPGRLMRSLKSILGTSLMHELAAVGERDYRYADIVTAYVRTLRQRAADAAGRDLDAVVLGRPIHFVDDDAAKDRAAQDTLAACARAAGFRHVEFQFEPIAAAFDYERTIAREELVLVVDVGGGTADFTVIRLGPSRRGTAARGEDILASGGVHVAGTDFDSRLNLAWVMPTLGYRSMGTKGRVVPSLVYFDLSTWHRINLLYAPKFIGTLRELKAYFTDLHPYRRLVHVIEHRLGHELLGRTEAAKIELSHAAEARIDLAAIEDDLATTGSRSELVAILGDLLARLVAAGAATVEAAGLHAADIDTLYFTGGSSGMTALRDAFVHAYPDSRVVVGDLFGSVASGLGVEAARRFGRA
ncbi:MAG: Hsp70 family protein [Burkholderiales bacterium]